MPTSRDMRKKNRAFQLPSSIVRAVCEIATFEEYQLYVGSFKTFKHVDDNGNLTPSLRILIRWMVNRGIMPEITTEVVAHNSLQSEADPPTICKTVLF